MTYLAHIHSFIYCSKVGAVDIDSGWSTGFNNFIFDTDKYPNASAMVLNLIQQFSCILIELEGV